MSIEVTVINNRNNPVVLELDYFDPRSSEKRAIIASRCQVLVGATLLDSSVNPDYFDLSQPDFITLKFWSAGLSVGRHPAVLYFFDDGHPLGELWQEFIINVKQG